MFSCAPIARSRGGVTKVQCLVVTTLRLLALEAGEKDQEDYVGVIVILLSFETNHWCGSQRTGSSAVSQPGSPLGHKAASDAESVVTALYGSMGAVTM